MYLLSYHNIVCFELTIKNNVNPNINESEQKVWKIKNNKFESFHSNSVTIFQLISWIYRSIKLRDRYWPQSFQN